MIDILKFLSKEDKILFFNDINNVIKEWETIAELNSIPHFQENAMKRFKELQKEGKIYANERRESSNSL